MKLTVPFIYDVAVIKPRCRKPSAALVRSEVVVEIPELTREQAPVAFVVLDRKIGSDEEQSESIRWADETLWQVDYETVHREPDRIVKADEIKHNIDTRYADYRFSGSGPAAPFHNSWQHLRYEDSASAYLDRQCSGLRSAWLKNDTIYGSPIYDKVEDVPARELVYSSRDAVVSLLKSIAGNLRLIDGILYHKGSEPRWCIYTFGHNHGGTSLSVDMHYNSNISHKRYFPADKKEEAIKAATQIATNRGDTKSVPINLHGSDIVVVIPEAVRVDPANQHGDGDPFINSLEARVDASNSVAEAGVMALATLASAVGQ